MDLIALTMAKAYTKSQKIIMDLPISSNVLFSGVAIPLDSDMTATLDRAAKNLIPVYLCVGGEKPGVESFVCVECVETLSVPAENDYQPFKHIFEGLCAAAVTRIEYSVTDATITGTLDEFVTE